MCTTIECAYDWQGSTNDSREYAYDTPGGLFPGYIRGLLDFDHAARTLRAPLGFTSNNSTGKERDSESGLDYFGARYYGSALGRFTSADWSEKPEPVPYADFSNPQTLNQYAYVLNNPLAHPDKDGHCCDDELTWAGNVAKSFANSFISLANTVINTPDPDVPIPNGPEINIPTFTVNSGSANVVGTVLGMAVPLGEGSGLSKGAQMLENAAQAAAGEAKVAGELVSEGTTILGSRVGVQTDKGLRVVDHLTDAGNGGLKAVQVKTGGATRNTAQLAKDDAMATRGGKIVGKNAPEGLRGQTRKIPTEVRKPNDQ